MCGTERERGVRGWKPGCWSEVTFSPGCDCWCRAPRVTGHCVDQPDPSAAWSPLHRVGQGDSCWISLPNGDDVLIDAGKSQAGASVVAYLQERGVDDVESMVATHGDTDHVAGMLGAQATMRPIPGTLGAPHCSHAPSSLSHASLIRARLTHSWHGSLSTRGHATCTRRADRHRYVAYSERLLTGRALEWSGWTVQMDGRSRSVCSPASRE